MHPRSLSVLVALAATFAALAPTDAQEIRTLDNSRSLRASKKGFVTVQSGDTLYDLSGRHMNDVYRWPQLWSYNAHITNPHWIYPGDIVYLRDPAGIDAAGGDSERALIPTQYHINTGGFITAKSPKVVGSITGSPKQAELFSEYDTVWVGFGRKSLKEGEDAPDEVSLKDPGSKPKVGDVFAIIRPVGALKSDGETVGQKYLSLGALRITEVSDKYMQTAEISQSWQELQRGDFLVPYEDQIHIIEPKPSDKDLVAQVVDTLRPTSNVGEFHYVFINKGSKDNLQPGQRFFVYQQLEGLTRIDPSEENIQRDEAFPPMRVGQVVVVDTEERFSTGLVIDSSREIFVGDRLEMYEGY